MDIEEALDVIESTVPVDAHAGQVFNQAVSVIEDQLHGMSAKIACLADELAALKAELAARSKQLGVACEKHDLIHSLACGVCLKDAVTELEALKAAQAWQPIETAPRDGTRVMVFRMLYLEDIAVCFYSKSQNEWVPVNGSVFCGGTHWMPLPPPPDGT